MLKTIHMKRNLLAASVLFIFGCSQQLWVKPGASQQDFGVDKYQCMQQAQQRVSGTYVNAYGGASTNKVITNEGLFNACMNSKGWSLQSSSSLQQSAAQQRQQAEQNQYQFEMLNQRRTAICQDPSFSAYYSKTPCKASDVSLAQLSDKSKITAAQRNALDLLSPEFSLLRKDVLLAQRNVGGKYNAEKVQALQSAFDAEDMNRLDLYSGKINWGQFNINRKRISKDLSTKMNAINLKR